MSYYLFSLASIRQRVQKNLSDITGIFFSNQDVNDSIQDIYDEFVLSTQCIESTISISFQNNQIYYDLYNGIPGFWRLSRLFNQATNRWIRCVDSRFLDGFRWDWESCNGTPWFAYIVNFQYLAFFPHYVQGAAKSFDALYKIAKDTLLNDGSTPQIPPPYIRAIEAGATADLLEQYQEFSKAGEYWADYQTLEDECRIHVAQRMSPDRYLIYQDLDFPMPSLP